MLIETFNEASIVGKLGILVAFAPIVCALLYAYRPTERRLTLMRPLSLAALFGGLSSFTAGSIAVLTGIAASEPVGWRLVLAGAAESVAALFITFGALTISWLLVALGLRRTP